MSPQKRKPVVLDTNVIVSGFLDGASYPAKIIDAWLFKHFQVAMSQELRQELNEVFKKPYISRILQDQKSIKPVLGRLLNHSIMVHPKTINTTYFPDETDHFLLELAVTAKAELIVTGDKKLLNVKKAKGVKLLSPKQFCFYFKII
ncbi:MAG: putative toxin-antitoxin system toxin component, PIN family [Oligoflexia bacterium]|nr:putative toxin-antitoxin system toxin component, PIN family [Oligoflexia bacterium]